MFGSIPGKCYYPIDHRSPEGGDDFYRRIPGQSTVVCWHGGLRYITSPEYGHKPRDLLPGYGSWSGWGANVAMEKVIAEAKHLTPDLGGAASTTGMGDAVAAAL